MFMGQQAARVVCLVCKIVCLPFYMSEICPLTSQLCWFHQVLCPNTCLLCHNIMSNFHGVYPS